MRDYTESYLLILAMAGAGKAIMVASMVQMGICMEIQPLLAYCYGSKDWRRLKEILQKIAILTLSLGTLGAHLVTYQLLTGPFIGLYYLSTNFLQASGSASGASIPSALRQGILLIPLLYLLGGLFQLEGLAFAPSVADCIAVLFTGVLALYYYRRITLRAKEEAEQ